MTSDPMAVEVVRLADEELGEFAAFVGAHPEVEIITAGPRMVIEGALRNARRQPPEVASRSVAGACGTAAAVLDGMLSRRPEYEGSEYGALRNVVVNLVSISRWVMP